MKAKICGITNAEDALFSIHNGAWGLGFNFYKKSPRYVSFENAKKIISQLPKYIIKVGILIDYSKDDILDALGFLDLVQVYQQDLFLPSDKSRLILSVSSINELPENSLLQSYGYILLDAPKQPDRLLGGTGRLADWGVAKHLAKNYKLILAGGLNSDNILDAIQQVRPFAVDVASGVEHSPGIKNPKSVKEFLTRCNNVK